MHNISYHFTMLHNSQFIDLSPHMVGYICGEVHANPVASVFTVDTLTMETNLLHKGYLG